MSVRIVALAVSVLEGISGLADFAASTLTQTVFPVFPAPSGAGIFSGAR